MVVESQDGTDFYTGVRPIIDYVFSGRATDMAILRPLIGFYVLYYYRRSHEPERESHYIGPGIRGGLRAFLGTRFSFDMIASTSYRFGKLEASIGDEGYSSVENANAHLFYLGFSLGISGWF